MNTEKHNTNPFGLMQSFIPKMEKIYLPLIEKLERHHKDTYKKFIFGKQSDVFVTFALGVNQLFDNVTAYSPTLRDSQEYQLISTFISRGEVHVTYKLKSMMR